MTKIQLKRYIETQREEVSVGNLEGVVAFLNRKGNPKRSLHAEARRNLVALIEQWQAAHHTTSRSRYEQDMVADFRRLFEKEKGFPYPNDAPLPRLPTLLKMKLPEGSPTFAVVQQNCKLLISPVGGGINVNTFYQPSGPWSPWDLAWSQFLILLQLQSSIRERFGGPCPYCGKYFVRNSKKQITYCSHHCASRDTAEKRTRAANQEKLETKLATAREAIAKWEKFSKERQRRNPWKEFVAAYDPSANITPKFLTQNVNAGKLKHPQERKPNAKG